jgi:hypothetical protein
MFLSCAEWRMRRRVSLTMWSKAELWDLETNPLNVLILCRVEDEEESESDYVEQSRTLGFRD